MAQKERGISDTPEEQKASSSNAGSAALSNSSANTTTNNTGLLAKDSPSINGLAKDSTGRAKDALGWGHLLWEKWRWGLLIAVAVVISRFSSTT